MSKGADRTVGGQDDAWLFPGLSLGLTVAQWALIEPLVPVLSTRGERPPKCPRRRLVDAILHVTRTGCSGRQLPPDFPPWATVLHYFQRWHADGTTDRNHAALCDAARGAEGAIRPPRPAWWTLSRCPVRRRSGRPRAAVTPASG